MVRWTCAALVITAAAAWADPVDGGVPSTNLHTSSDMLDQAQGEKGGYYTVHRNLSDDEMDAWHDAYEKIVRTTLARAKDCPAGQPEYAGCLCKKLLATKLPKPPKNGTYTVR